MDANAHDDQGGERDGFDPRHRASDVRRVHSAGDVLAGKYRLERPIGEGGQATVWEAHNISLDARVALKLVHPELSNPGQAERLLREARAVASLRHPAVVRVFDVEQTSHGDWFIVMELLDGESLADRLADGRRLSSVEAMRLLLPIAEALVAAHAAGIVHRDVKPDNIVLARAGKHLQPKLLDFGIAKVRRDTDWKRTTVRGVLMGTPAYLSPEQAACTGDVDHRSDIWSFSATVYECVTGRLPFEGESEDELFQNIVRQEPRSILAHSAGDSELWSLLEGGLKKSRDERWPTMQALGSGLARWLLTQGISEDARGVSIAATWLGTSAPPPTVTSRAVVAPTRVATPRKWAAIGVGCVTVLALFIAWRFAPAAPEAQPGALKAPVTVAPVRSTPEVVPLSTPSAVPPTLASMPTPASSSLPVRDIKKSTPRPRVTATPTASPKPSPAPRASAPADGLRLLNPY